MLLSSFLVDWFDIDFTYFKLNLGWFAVIYSALLLWKNIYTRMELDLTPRELHDWGDRLSLATPEILERAEQGQRPREIAQELLAKHGIPEIVSLKYMVVLARVKKKALLNDQAGQLENEQGDGDSQ